MSNYSPVPIPTELPGPEIPEGMDARSVRIEEAMSTPLLIAAALTLPMVAITESHPGGWLEELAGILNWVTWGAFAVELVVMMAVVPDRRAWLRRHPLDPIVVFLTPPVLPPGLQGLRVLRLLRLLRLLELARLSRDVFSLRGLHYATLLATLTAIAGGALFVALEESQEHLSTWDGIYWAITTMTTLGSGIETTTTEGQILQVVLVIVGISFVALLTGAVAQRFFSPELGEVEREIEDELVSAEVVAQRELRSIREQLSALEVAIGRMIDDRSPG